jgi:hypothetical protein
LKLQLAQEGREVPKKIMRKMLEAVASYAANSIEDSAVFLEALQVDIDCLKQELASKPHMRVVQTEVHALEKLHAELCGIHSNNVASLAARVASLRPGLIREMQAHATHSNVSSANTWTMAQLISAARECYQRLCAEAAPTKSLSPKRAALSHADKLAKLAQEEAKLRATLQRAEEIVCSSQAALERGTRELWTSLLTEAKGSNCPEIRNMLDGWSVGGPASEAVAAMVHYESKLQDLIRAKSESSQSAELNIDYMAAADALHGLLTLTEQLVSDCQRISDDTMARLRARFPSHSSPLLRDVLSHRTVTRAISAAQSAALRSSPGKDAVLEAHGKKRHEVRERAIVIQ